MEITRDTLKKYGKLAGIGVVGAGLGAGALSYADNGPTDDEYENLRDKVSDLEDRPTEEELQELESQVESLEDRPTEEELQKIKNEMSTMFTQEEVNEMVADATEREDVSEFLPSIADEDVELVQLNAADDEETTASNVANNIPPAGDSVFDDDEFEGEDYDEVRANYEHDDGHDYDVVIREFEDSEDADVYEEGLRDAVEDAEYDESLTEDAEVVRSGDTVVYLYGQADEKDYDSYDFDAVASQY